MSSSSILVCFSLLICFIFYKRDMLSKICSTDVISQTVRFQEQLEQTADNIIKRLEEQINQLEYLLEEANGKINSLDNKIQIAIKILNKENNNVNKYLNQPIIEDITTNIAIVTNEIATKSIDNSKDMGRNDKRSSIIDMADLGYDITEIAKTTGISKGEIMLLIQLNKKSKQLKIQ